MCLGRWSLLNHRCSLSAAVMEVGVGIAFSPAMLMAREGTKVDTEFKALRAREAAGSGSSGTL